MTVSLRALAVVAALLCAAGCTREPEPEPAHRFALIVADEGARSRELERGARRAAEPLDVEVIWRGAFGEVARDDQALLVRQAVAEGFDGLVVVPGAPLDETLATAVRRGVPFVVIGPPAAETQAVSHVWHDAHDAGRRAADEVAARLGGTGRVGLVLPPRSDAEASGRLDGVVDGLAAHPGLTVDLEIATGASEGESARAVLDVMHRVRDVDALIAPTEATTLGTLTALREGDLYGERLLVGFGATSLLLDAVAAQGIAALVVDDPARLADQAVRALVSHRSGHPVPAEQPVPSFVVTLANRAQVLNSLLER